MSNSERVDTVVIGGAQAGLAAAYYLSKAGNDFVVLESQGRIGETWRRRWDSLRLFTPAKFDGLPGMPYPASDFYFPTKDEIADYLNAYADKFRLPVRLGTPVDSLARENGTFSITSGSKIFSARNVIVATGAYQTPVIPPFAGDLRPDIVQMHSSVYRNPSQVPQGNVLLVGAGNSGAEIAIELAHAGRNVTLAGRDVGRIPADRIGRILGGKPYWAFISRVLNVHTPVGRRVRQKALRQGTPLIRLKPKDVLDAGVTRCGRVQGTSGGQPLLDDGSVLDVAAVIWATGYRPDYSWIKLPIFDEHGCPLHRRGVVTNNRGIYFLGLHFQTALSSALLGGVGADAQFITSRIQSGEVQ